MERAAVIRLNSAMLGVLLAALACLAWGVAWDAACDADVAGWGVALWSLRLPADWQTEEPGRTIIAGPTVMVDLQSAKEWRGAPEAAEGECVAVEVTTIDQAGNRDDGRACP